MAKNKVEIDSDLEDLIPQFIENRKKDLVQLEGLAAAKDSEAIAQLAHRIKGAAAGYGFAELSALAAELEISAKAKQTQDFQPIVRQMIQHFGNIEVHYVPMS